MAISSLADLSAEPRGHHLSFPQLGVTSTLGVTSALGVAPTSASFSGAESLVIRWAGAVPRWPADTEGT